jgi:hypothetical protein
MAAQLPELQPMVDHIQAFLNERGWTVTTLCERAYGRDDYGKVRGAGSVHPLLYGARRPGPHLTKMLLDGAGLDLTPWASKPGTRKAWPQTRAAAAVAEYEAEQATQAPPAALTLHVPEIEPPPRLALVLKGDRGSLTFNLLDAPASEVLRAFGVLRAAGLAGAEGE